MRKGLCLLVTFFVMFSGISGVFASELSDLAGTPYEYAVTRLIEKGIVSGHNDGTFKPESEINRAEACTMIVRMLISSESELENVASSNFTDFSGYSWAKSYVDYAAAKGIVSGYKDGTFRPGATITYNELAAMLVNAFGYNSSDLTGSWPANYFNKATELGLFRNLVIEGTLDGKATVNRGNAVIMAYAASLAHLNTGEGYITIADEKEDEDADIRQYKTTATQLLAEIENAMNKMDFSIDLADANAVAAAKENAEGIYKTCLQVKTLEVPQDCKSAQAYLEEVSNAYQTSMRLYLEALEKPDHTAAASTLEEAHYKVLSAATHLKDAKQKLNELLSE